MAYDPKKPTDRHNSYPEKLWPIKKGTKVYYISTEMRVGNPSLQEGKIAWYSPRPGPQTTGKPFYNILTDGDRTEHAYPELIYPRTSAGKRLALHHMAKWLRDAAASSIRDAEAAIEQSDKLIAEAESLKPNAKSRDVIRKVLKTAIARAQARM